MLRRHIGNYNFVGDAKTGITLRWGKTINDNPIFAPVPEISRYLYIKSLYKRMLILL